MTSAERIKAIFNFEVPDRIGMYDTYWEETLQRWYGEGLPEDVEPQEYFGVNDLGIIPVDTTFQFKEEVLEETDTFVIRSDKEGAVYKWLKSGVSTPHPLDHKIKTKQDWLKHKGRLQANESRIDKEIKQKYRKFRDEGKFIVLTGITEPYNAVWPRHGTEATLMDMIRDPEWMKDMFSAQTDLIIDTVRLILDKGIKVDGIWAGGDLGYKNGPLFSPDMFRELLFPYYRKMCDFFKQNGFPVILHSDGDIRALIPLLLESGIRALQPLESKVGIDVCKLKEEYRNRLVLFGNIDVRTMSRTKQEIEEEIKRKVLIAKVGGGYIYHSDHSIPPNVSLENYRFVIKTVRKYGKY